MADKTLLESSTEFDTLGDAVKSLRKVPSAFIDQDLEIVRKNDQHDNAVCSYGPDENGALPPSVVAAVTQHYLLLLLLLLLRFVLPFCSRYHLGCTAVLFQPVVAVFARYTCHNHTGFVLSHLSRAQAVCTSCTTNERIDIDDSSMCASAACFYSNYYPTAQQQKLLVIRPTTNPHLSPSHARNLRIGSRWMLVSAILGTLWLTL